MTNPFDGSIADDKAWEGFDAHDTALLVVDLQYFDAHPDWGEGLTARRRGVEHLFAPMFSAVREALPRVRRLMDVARARNIEVIHVRVAERTADCRDVGRKQRVRGLFVPRDSKEAEFLPEVAPAGDELVISKSSSGVFPWTNLDMLLRAMGIAHLVMTGISTGGCVESAVRDATDFGYHVTIVDDACVDSSRQSHQAALDRMRGGSVRVVPAGTVAAEFAAHPIRTIPPMALPEAGVLDPDDPYRAIFGPPVEPALDTDTSALVLMNFQRFSGHPASSLAQSAWRDCSTAHRDQYYARVGTAVSGATTLLGAAREVGIPVIHLPQGSPFPDGRDVPIDRRRRGWMVHRESPDAAFLPGFEPRSGEPVYWRSAAGAFNGTGLDRILQVANVEEIILAGLSYDGSVEGTVRGAGDRGYTVVLVPGACAEPTEARQLRLGGLGGGVVRIMEVDQVIERLGETITEGECGAS